MIKQQVAREMLRIFNGDPARWCQGALALGSDDWFAGVDSGDACKFCILGAYLRAVHQLECVCPQPFFSELDEGPESWNDAPARTFDDVVQLLNGIAEAP